MRAHIIITIFGLILTFFPLYVAAESEAPSSPCYDIAYPENIETYKAFKPAFKQLYESAGLCANIVTLHYNRADTALRQEYVDANAFRTKPYIDKSPFVSYVDTPLLMISAYIFGDDSVKNLVSRNVSDGKISRPIGYLASNQWAKSIAIDLSTEAIAVRSHPQLISMLETGRIAGFIIDDLNYNLLRNNNAINLDHYTRKFVGTYPLYHVINSKHKHILPALSAAAKQASEDGIFIKAYKKWLREDDVFYLKFSTTSSKERFPFTIGLNGDKDRTLLLEAISMILNETPYTPRRFDISMTSRVDAIKSGSIDFITFSPSWLSDGTPFTGAIFSEPLFNISDTVVCQKKLSKNVTNLEQLYERKVATISGYHYFDEDKLNRQDYSSEAVVLNALHNNEIDCGIVGTLNFQAYMKRHNADLAPAFIHSAGAYHLLVREELKHIINDINKVIIKKRNNGELQALLEDYITKVAAPE